MKSQKIVLAALLVATISTKYTQTMHEEITPIEINNPSIKPLQSTPPKALIIDAYHADSVKDPYKLLPSNRVNNNDSTIVTPAAFLKSVLSKNSTQDAISKFNSLKMGLKNRDNEWVNLSPEDQKLIQQAQTLLVRAHPEILGNDFVKIIGYLPNRFVSYFKEKMPTFSQDAARQRFTQSVVMEALKSMNQSDMSIDREKLQNQIDNITKKYTDDLSTATNTQMFLQWCRNLLVDLALLAPRTAAAAVGGAVGLTGNIITRTIPEIVKSIDDGIQSAANTGAQIGNVISSGYHDRGLFDHGYDASNYAQNQSSPEYVARTAIAIPAAIATGATVGAANTAINLGRAAVAIPTTGVARGAQYGTKLVDQAAISIGNAVQSTSDYIGSLFNDQSTNNFNN
ncbi:MAG: hypothetical protein ACXWL5_01280 [Candidatus Chromulinivorax sp.]